MTASPERPRPLAAASEAGADLDMAIGRRHPCAWCDSDNHASATKCRVCGSMLRHVAPTVECARCRHTQPSSLLICARCGTENRPRGVQLPWLIPVLTAVAVFLVLLWM